jgi:hypothetical protein
VKDFGFFRRSFLKIIFLHGEIFECFHYSSFAYFLMQMARPQCDTPLVAEECGWVGRRRGGFVTNVFVLVFFVFISPDQ